MLVVVGAAALIGSPFLPWFDAPLLAAAGLSTGWDFLEKASIVLVASGVALLGLTGWSASDPNRLAGAGLLVVSAASIGPALYVLLESGAPVDGLGAGPYVALAGALLALAGAVRWWLVVRPVAEPAGSDQAHSMAGPIVAAAAALLVFGTLFMEWAGDSVTVISSHGQAVVNTKQTGWTLMNHADVAIAVLCVATVVLAMLTLGSRRSHSRIALVVVSGALFGLVLTTAIEADGSILVGALLALLGGLAAVAAAARATIRSGQAPAAGRC